MEIGITPSNPEALEDDWVILGQALSDERVLCRSPDLLSLRDPDV